MALNKFMHPRNIYKTPPDFSKLAKLFPEFSSISKLDVTGKTTIDFKEPRSLRILTKCLLKNDFNLDIDIPNDRLVPTLPLRLNYILWIEDLLIAVKRGTDIQGLDIGTGACAIYPLLGAVKNKWHMMGTETDAQSLAKAKENIQNNNLQEFVKLKKNTTTSVIDHVFKDENKPTFDFCMCNPPFYSNIQELCESRSPARLPPKNGFTGSPQELITEGGELEFCRKLIAESKKYQEDVLIFTTMVGHKYNLNVLLQDLTSEGVRHTHTEFCQGRVTRWGLAWSYKDYDLHNLVPPRDKPRKKSTPTVYMLPELPKKPYNVEVACDRIKELLNTLSIRFKIVDKRGNRISIDIIANTNTWSHQRRKRRLMKTMEGESKRTKVDKTTDSYASEQNGGSSTNIANNVESMESNDTKVNEDVSDINLNKSNTIDEVIEEVVVHAFLKLLKKENDILLEMDFLDGTAGKEGLHQIAQYIKNNWK